MNKIQMQKKQSQWKKLAISLILLFLSIILGAVLMPIGIIYTVGAIIFRIFNPSRRNPIEKTVGYLANTIKSLALGIDQIGNVIGRDLFNKILIVPGGHKFGNVHETISSVLGHNQITDTLTDLGKWLANLLDKVEKNHCRDAIIYFIKK